MKRDTNTHHTSTYHIHANTRCIVLLQHWHGCSMCRRNCFSFYILFMSTSSLSEIEQLFTIFIFESFVFGRGYSVTQNFCTFCCCCYQFTRKMCCQTKQTNYLYRSIVSSGKNVKKIIYSNISNRFLNGFDVDFFFVFPFTNLPGCQ